MRGLWRNIRAENFSDSAPRSPARSPSAACHGAWRGAAAGGAAWRGCHQRARFHRRQRARPHERRRAATAEAFAVKDGRFVAVGSTSDIRNLATRAHAGHRRAAHDRRARLHRRPLPSERRAASCTTSTPTCAPSREIQAAIAQKAAQTPPGVWVVGFMFDDTKLGRRPLHRQRPRRGGAGASGARRPPRRPHDVVQQQGVRARRHHQGHARPGARPLLPRRQGELTGRVAEQARDVFDRVGKRERRSRRSSSASARARAWRTCPSC